MSVISLQSPSGFPSPSERRNPSNGLWGSRSSQACVASALLAHCPGATLHPPAPSLPWALHLYFRLSRRTSCFLCWTVLLSDVCIEYSLTSFRILCKFHLFREVFLCYSMKNLTSDCSLSPLLCCNSPHGAYSPVGTVWVSLLFITTFPFLHYRR